MPEVERVGSPQGLGPCTLRACGHRRNLSNGKQGPARNSMTHTELCGTCSRDLEDTRSPGLRPENEQELLGGEQSTLGMVATQSI